MKTGAALAPGWSIALCTYDGEPFLQTQLKSILQQELQPVEVVVVDDASTDGTWDLLQAFRADAPFAVTLVRQDANVGSLRSFERAISLTTGEFVALADQDDEWLPHKLAVLNRCLTEDPNAAAVFSDLEVIDETGRSMGFTAWSTEQVGFGPSVRESLGPGEYFRFLLGANVVTGAALGFRGCFRDVILPFPARLFELPPWRIHDGWIALVLSAIGDVHAVAQPLVRYRTHPNQQVGVSLTLPSVIGREVDLDVQLEVRARNLAAVVDRLRARQEVYPPKNAPLEDLEMELEHLRARAHLRRERGRRFFRSLRKELGTGRYKRWSGGMRGAVRDLFETHLPWTSPAFAIERRAWSTIVAWRQRRARKVGAS